MVDEEVDKKMTNDDSYDDYDDGDGDKINDDDANDESIIMNKFSRLDFKNDDDYEEYCFDGDFEFFYQSCYDCCC